ncbi:Short chain dehydrogenase atnD [Pseudohyphozyma bogoriensis]|nr:Short chain dehydrogenase atnD [Pseudohyphozyma bogoriensis]
MMQYSALSPLELHERGAELVRVLLKRDRSLRKVGRDDPDVGDCEPEDLIEGPMIARTKRCGFHEAEDEEDLWHHAMMIGLQLHSRYPEHEDGLPAILNLSDRVPALTEAEVSRVLYRHWKSTYAWLKDQGGLHGPTVDGFRGSTTEPEKLVLNCDDVMSVVAALEETDKTGVRTMVYNAAVSEERNHWMQTGYWSDQADECVHAGMTGNLLEIEAHYPHFAEGTVHHVIVMATTKTVLREQFFGRMKDITTPLDGRVAIVTGSNVGLGYASALHLARLNASHIILAVRNTSAGKEAADKIQAATGFKGLLEVWELDLASFASVKTFARKCETLQRLDIVIQNAAVGTMKWAVTDDGWEKSLQTNDLSNGLLCLLLLPLMARTAERYPQVKPHLTIVGSEVHTWAKFIEKDVPGSTLAALNSEQDFQGGDRYQVTKLINLFIARKLATLPIASSVVISMVNPGLCVSELRREFPSFAQWLSNKLARSAAVGARNIVWAAVDLEQTGVYVPSPWSTSAEGFAVETKLWDEMSVEWEKLAPEVSRILI